MESILESIALLVQAVESLNDFFGVELQLVVPVLILVSLIAGLTKLRERWPNYKNSLLATLAFIIGCLVAFAMKGFDPSTVVLREGLLLGSLSALTYQFVKPFFKGFVKVVSVKYRSITGQELEPPEDFM